MTNDSKKPTNLSHASLDQALGTINVQAETKEVGSNVNKTRILPSLISHEVIAGMTSLKGLWVAAHENDNGKFKTHPLKLFPIVIAKGLKKSGVSESSILMESEYLQETDNYSDATDGDEGIEAALPPSEEDEAAEQPDALDQPLEPVHIEATTNKLPETPATSDIRPKSDPKDEETTDVDVVKGLVDTEIEDSDTQPVVSIGAESTFGKDIDTVLPTDVGLITYAEDSSEDVDSDSESGSPPPSSPPPSPSPSSWRGQLNKVLIGFGLERDIDTDDGVSESPGKSDQNKNIDEQPSIAKADTNAREDDDGVENAKALERAATRAKQAEIDNKPSLSQDNTEENKPNNSKVISTTNGSDDVDSSTTTGTSTFIDAISHLSLSSFRNQNTIATFIDNINTLMSSMSDWGGVRKSRVGEVGAGSLVPGVSSKDAIGALIVPIVKTIYQQASKSVLTDITTEKRFKGAILATLSNPQMETKLFGPPIKNTGNSSYDMSSLNKYKQLCVSLLTIVMQLAEVSDQTELSDLKKPIEEDYIARTQEFRKVLSTYNRQVMCRDILNSMWFSKHTIRVIGEGNVDTNRHTSATLDLDKKGTVIEPAEADRYSLGVNLEEGANEGFFIAINIALSGKGATVNKLKNGGYSVVGMGITDAESSYGTYFGSTYPDKQNNLYVQKVLINYMSNSSSSASVVSDLLTSLSELSSTIDKLTEIKKAVQYTGEKVQAQYSWINLFLKKVTERKTIIQNVLSIIESGKLADENLRIDPNMSHDRQLTKCLNLMEYIVPIKYASDVISQVAGQKETVTSNYANTSNDVIGLNRNKRLMLILNAIARKDMLDGHDYSDLKRDKQADMSDIEKLKWDLMVFADFVRGGIDFNDAAFPVNGKTKLSCKEIIGSLRKWHDAMRACGSLYQHKDFEVSTYFYIERSETFIDDNKNISKQSVVLQIKVVCETGANKLAYMIKLCVDVPALPLSYPVQTVNSSSVETATKSISKLIDILNHCDQDSPLTLTHKPTPSPTPWNGTFTSSDLVAVITNISKNANINTKPSKVLDGAPAITQFDINEIYVQLAQHFNVSGNIDKVRAVSSLVIEKTKGLKHVSVSVDGYFIRVDPVIGGIADGKDTIQLRCADFRKDPLVKSQHYSSQRDIRKSINSETKGVLRFNLRLQTLLTARPLPTASEGSNKLTIAKLLTGYNNNPVISLKKIFSRNVKQEGVDKIVDYIVSMIESDNLLYSKITPAKIEEYQARLSLITLRHKRGAGPKGVDKPPKILTPTIPSRVDGGQLVERLNMIPLYALLVERVELLKNSDVPSFAESIKENSKRLDSAILVLGDDLIKTIRQQKALAMSRHLGFIATLKGSKS